MAGTPIESLYSIDSSLDHSPATSFTHVTGDFNRRWAADGFDFVQTSDFWARTEYLGTVCTHKTHILYLLYSTLRYFQQHCPDVAGSWRHDKPVYPVSWLWSVLALLLWPGWLRSWILCRRSSCLWSWLLRSFSRSRRWVTSSWQLSDAYMYAHLNQYAILS